MDGIESNIWELSEQSKLLAGFVYFLFVILEVTIAPIPGAILYAPGGAIFGTFWGGLLSLFGNVVGAGIACWIARTISNRSRNNREQQSTESQSELNKEATRHDAGWFHNLQNSPAFEKLKETISKHGGWLIFVLRLNPLTSSDLISYAAGFSTIPISRVMFATLLGMAPLCFLQAWASKSLLEAFPNLWIPLLVVCGVYVLLAIYFIRRTNRKPSED